MMENHGFVNIQEKRFQIPLGSWGPELTARHLGAVFGNYLNEFSGLLRDRLSWNEVEKALTGIRYAYGNKSHAYMEFYVVYGQKPKAW
jgi:hypothetical protein